MANPRIFISSTFIDLQELRHALGGYITSHFGYEPVFFERSDVLYEFNASLEESCYDEIKLCQMFILIIGSSFGEFSKTSLQRTSESGRQSVTQNEYRTAKGLRMPIFIFISRRTQNEYNNFKRQRQGNDFKFSMPNGRQLMAFLDELYAQKSFQNLVEFETFDDITTHLRKQWAGHFHKYLADAMKKVIGIGQTSVKVNPYKLYLVRKEKGISIKALARLAEIPESVLKKLESAGKPKQGPFTTESFGKTSMDNLQKICSALNCDAISLKAGLVDDFATRYILYYHKYRGATRSKRRVTGTPSLFKTKIVFFDFDGTLTYYEKGEEHFNTWEKLWLALGYDINDCADLHDQFNHNKITHAEWCDLTCKKFTERGLTRDHVIDIASHIKLVPGTEEVIDTLNKKGIPLYVISGSIKDILKQVLGDLYHKFEEVKANEFYYDDDGKLTSIKGTKYDFEGKRDFIIRAITENQIQNHEAFFVGNSLNDTFAHLSGAQTLCVNPMLTNPHSTEWTYSIRKMENLKQIFKFLIV